MVSKKRPRATPRFPGEGDVAKSKTEPKYWRHRVFKSAYVYKGRRALVNHWSVKIQYQGLRKTFSLRSCRRNQAAAEACDLYRALVTEGWESVGGKFRPAALAEIPPRNTADRFGASYWEQRLVHRQYTMSLTANEPRELAVRVDHGGTGHYFPLGTNSRKLAAVRARRIYQAATRQGWAFVNQRYRRELTVAFHWQDHPLAWTYTTIHTLESIPPSTVAPRAPEGTHPLQVVLVEPDPGIRRALAWCISRMEGFRCAATFSGAAEMVQGTFPRPPHLVLVNDTLPDKPGSLWLEPAKRQSPTLGGVLYSVYMDSEELFRTTPGGAGTYLLRRTSPIDFLGPVTSLAAQGSAGSHTLTAAIWQYFKDGLASPPTARSAAELLRLTQREQEVLALLTKGHPDKDIADRLDISIHTVHEHVRNIFEKLGVHNRTEAAVKFLQK